MSSATTIWRLMEAEKCFRRACSHITMLNQVLAEMQKRYEMASKQHMRAFRYSLRLRIAVTEGVRNMFYEYATVKADLITELRKRAQYEQQQQQQQQQQLQEEQQQESDSELDSDYYDDYGSDYDFSDSDFNYSDFDDDDDGGYDCEEGGFHGNDSGIYALKETNCPSDTSHVSLLSGGAEFAVELQVNASDITENSEQAEETSALADGGIVLKGGDEDDPPNRTGRK